jgi:hypothetical protein
MTNLLSFPGDRAIFPVIQNTTWPVLLPPSTYSTSCLFTIWVPCLTDWFHCLLLACLVVNIAIIWVATFPPVFFYFFVQMAYRFSVWSPLLLPSSSVVFLAAKVSLPFEAHRYNTGAHLTLRESKVLFLGRIRPLQMYWGARFYYDGTNRVTRLDINLYLPQNNYVNSRIYCTYEHASFDMIYDIFINCNCVVNQWQYTFTHKQ